MSHWFYPRVLAHRGGGTLAPENTLRGIETGAAHGARMIEFDAKLSADDVVFLLHDDHVDRTSNARGAARELSYAAIRQFDAGAWFDPRFAGEAMPTLDAVAHLCRTLGLRANIEIKPCAGRERETGAAVAKSAAALWSDQPAPLLSSFSYDALSEAARVAPHVPRGRLYSTVPAHWREDIRALDCVAIHTNYRHLDQRTAEAIKTQGLGLMVYTVNDFADAVRMLSWGVDAICTDRIDLINEATLHDALGLGDRADPLTR